jgi:hypothetical protein
MFTLVGFVRDAEDELHIYYIPGPQVVPVLSNMEVSRVPSPIALLVWIVLASTISEADEVDKGAISPPTGLFQVVLY